MLVEAPRRMACRRTAGRQHIAALALHFYACPLVAITRPSQGFLSGDIGKLLAGHGPGCTGMDMATGFARLAWGADLRQPVDVEPLCFQQATPANEQVREFKVEGKII